MAIPVVCPGCHKRFQVSDKFAGQKGPCPHCKAVIQVPKKEEEVVVHAPEQFGPKTKSGQSVLQPIFREETKFSPGIAALVGVATLMVFALALVIRVNTRDEGGPPGGLLGFGALLLGPAVAWAGYWVLRDAELEPFRGAALWLRAAICGVVYALIWGILAWAIKDYLLEFGPNDTFDSFQLAMVIPGMLALGAFTAHVALDLEVSNAAVHYGFYLLVTVLLRLTLGMTVI
jgi:hypothetical protein